MKRSTRTAALAISLALLLTPASALSAAPETGAPSPWAAEAVEKAVTLGFVPDALQENYSLSISRGEFAQVALHFLCAQYNYYDANNRVDLNAFLSLFPDSPKGKAVMVLSKDEAWALLPVDRQDAYREEPPSWSSLFHDIAPFSDVEEGYYINAAHVLGIVNGRGNDIFAPDDPITRQEAALMLERVYRLYGDAPTPAPPSFSDLDSIAPWASSAIALMEEYHVMEGTGDNLFSPTDSYTREQCYITFLRLYENMPVNKAHGNVTPFSTLEEDISLLEGGFWLSSSRLYESDSILLMLAHYGGLPHGASYDTLTLFYKSGGMRGVHGPNIPLSDDFRLRSADSAFLTFDMGGFPCRLDLATGLLTAI